MKLREIGVVTSVGISNPYEISSVCMPKCSSELHRLFADLEAYERRREFYADGNTYVTQIKESVANEINKYYSRDKS